LLKACIIKFFVVPLHHQIRKTPKTYNIMKIAINNFPAIYNICDITKPFPFIIGITNFYRSEFSCPSNAIFKKGWQPMEFGNEKSKPTTPEQLEKLLKSLEKTGVNHIEFNIAFDGGQQTTMVFKMKDLIEI
jgi:hypothetical protein